MVTVNMHDAKSRLSSLVESLELGQESEVILARNGTPVAKLVPFSTPKRIGAAKHILAGLNLPKTVEAFNEGDTDIAAEFEKSAKDDILP
jgi:antitoxin (DNA-binding transcriptional repressor) of toxin-antitoxin stability system